MAAFLEEVLPVDVRLAATWSDGYAVQVSTTSAGQEHRRLVHPLPRRRWTVAYSKAEPEMWDEVLSLYHRCHGRYAGFRVRCSDDYTTNARTLDPTATDVELEVLDPGADYQLMADYSLGGALTSAGRPVRRVYKPVAGTVLVAIRNAITGDHVVQDWTVDTTTGVVSFPNKAAAITGISKAGQAVVSVASHPFSVGDSVRAGGVSGMTQINDRRADVTATTSTSITLDLSSLGFSTYTSGGTIQVAPGAGEAVRAGCEYDLPARFDSDLQIGYRSRDWRETGEIDIVELIAP